MTDFIFLHFKIIADSDYCHEIKRHLLLRRKALTNLDSVLKSRDITLPTKVCIVKAIVFPVVMYRCESWTIKKIEPLKNWCFWTVVLEKTLFCSCCFWFFCFVLFLFFYFFIFICSGFCHTLKWNSHGFTCVPHPDPPSHLPLYPLPLGFPSAPGA